MINKANLEFVFALHFFQRYFSKNINLNFVTPLGVPQPIANLTFPSTTITPAAYKLWKKSNKSMCSL
jgi:hypothetical protein